MRFHTVVELGGKTATGLPVPEAVVHALAAGRRPAVKVTIAGYSYRSTIGSRGGVFLLPLSAEHRTAAGVAAGDEVEVDVEVDTAPRTVDVPEVLASALAESGLRDRFDALSYSAQLRHVFAVDAARTDETRARRVAGVLTDLAG